MVDVLMLLLLLLVVLLTSRAKANAAAEWCISADFP